MFRNIVFFVTGALLTALVLYLVVVEGQVGTLNTQIAAARQENNALRAQIALLKDSDTHKVALADGSAKVNTYLYYNTTRQEIALDLGGIPAPPEGQKQWAWGMTKGQFVPLAPVQRTAIGSWQPLPYQAGLDSFLISQETTGERRDFPEIVIMHGR